MTEARENRERRVRITFDRRGISAIVKELLDLGLTQEELSSATIYEGGRGEGTTHKYVLGVFIGDRLVCASEPDGQKPVANVSWPKYPYCKLSETDFYQDSVKSQA